MKKLLTLAFLLLAGRMACAGDPNAAAKAGPVVDTAPTAADSTAGIYVPKKKSVFIGTENDHNPFWPIGWVKTEALPTADNAAPVVPTADDFTLTTIMLNDPPLVVINGKDMAEGEVAQFEINGQPVMVQLMAVQDGRVVLRWQNQNLVIPLHRDEAVPAAATASVSPP